MRAPTRPGAAQATTHRRHGGSRLSKTRTTSSPIFLSLPATPDAKPSSIASVAAATPTLSTLTAALAKANMTQWLSNSTQVATVFAPTDAAFGSYLSKNGLTAQQLLDSPNLKAILKYHIVPGVAAKSTDLKNGQVVPTKLGGAPLTVDLSKGVVIKGSESSANVITADVPAGAAVVHVVDAVLVPSTANIADAKAKWEATKAEKAKAAGGM